MIDRVIDLVEERTTLLLGTWNQASPALFEWRSLQRDSSTSGATGAAIALDVVVPGRHAGGAEKVLRRLRGPSPPQQIVILDVDARTAPSPEWATAFATETEWLAPAYIVEGVRWLARGDVVAPDPALTLVMEAAVAPVEEDGGHA